MGVYLFIFFLEENIMGDIEGVPNPKVDQPEKY